MNATKEGQLWQAMGLAAILGGGAFLARVASIYGIITVDYSSLSLGLAASFIMLAGGAAFVGGRVLVATASGAGRSELTLWRLLAAVGIGAGTVTVYLAHRQSLAHPLPSMDQLALGLAGSFVLMAGILALLGQRILRHLGGKSSPLSDHPTDEMPAVQPKK